MRLLQNLGTQSHIAILRYKDSGVLHCAVHSCNSQSLGKQKSSFQTPERLVRFVSHKNITIIKRNLSYCTWPCTMQVISSVIPKGNRPQALCCSGKWTSQVASSLGVGQLPVPRGRPQAGYRIVRSRGKSAFLSFLSLGCTCQVLCLGRFPAVSRSHGGSPSGEVGTEEAQTGGI